MIGFIIDGIKTLLKMFMWIALGCVIFFSMIYLGGCAYPKEITINLRYLDIEQMPTKKQRDIEMLINRFDKKEDRLLLRAIERAEGDIIKLAPYLNIYNQSDSTPTHAEFYEFIKNGVFYNVSGGTFLDKWWEKVMMNYKLLENGS